MKKWYKSKTVWSGIVKILVGVGGVASQFLAGEVNVQVLSGSIMSAVWGVFDIVVRFKTVESIV